MPGDPVLRALLNGDWLARLVFELLPVMLDLADLFDHAGAEQGVLIDEGDAHQIVALLASAPGYHAGIARLIAQQRDAQLDRGAATKAP